MNYCARIREAKSGQRQRGIALLYWIAVLAVVVMLTAFLLPALIREIDVRVAREESASLKTLGNALQSAAQRHGYMPAEAGWAGTVAAEAGMASASVATNPRRQPRLLLIDTSGWFTNVSLPYIQTPAGN